MNKHPAEKEEKLAAEETKSEARAAAAEEKLAEKAAAKEEALAAKAAAAEAAKEAAIEKVGDPDNRWQVVASAESKEESWRKVTRRMAVSNGAIYQTETRRRNPDGSYALSQATVFVPA
jgi:hypothetical protein